MDARPSSLAHQLGLLVRPEFEMVEISGVRRSDSSMLPVRCVKPNARELAEVMRALPGDRPATVKEHDPTDEAEDAFLRWAPRLIERWALVELNGEWVQAFTFSDPPDPDRIPGSELTLPDVSKLAIALMRLGGYLGGDAAGTFLDQRGGGGNGG